MHQLRVTCRHCVTNFNKETKAAKWNTESEHLIKRYFHKHGSMETGGGEHREGVNIGRG